MRFDVAIMGGGPTGLALARALSGCGLSIAVIERQAEAALADPAYDGREIALTHLSQQILRALGAWDELPPGLPSDLREAQVLNGGSPYALRFDTAGRQEAALGQLVANHELRRALFRVASACPDVTLLAGRGVESLATDVDGARLRLSDGTPLTARLLVAADSRFSAARRALGIAAEQRDFGKTMMVCRLRHEKPHQHIATEWFDYGQTIAMLPLNGNLSSAVITLKPEGIAALMALPPEELGPEIARRYRHRLGAMQLDSSCHAYPLVATYAERFTAPSAALIGDAAVGMHPVTAHGFNFGLRGQDLLATAIRQARGQGRDFAAPDVLRRYAHAHRRHTRALWLATNATALIYTHDTPPARLLRAAALRLGNGLAPFRRAVTSHLMESGAGGR